MAVEAGLSRMGIHRRMHVRGGLHDGCRTLHCVPSDLQRPLEYWPRIHGSDDVWDGRRCAKWRGMAPAWLVSKRLAPYGDFRRPAALRGEGRPIFFCIDLQFRAGSRAIAHGDARDWNMGARPRALRYRAGELSRWYCVV